MTSPLSLATRRVSEHDLRWMVLDVEELPSELQAFHLSREGSLDNEAMAEHGFPGNTAERFRRIGRVGGYSREYASPLAGSSPPEGMDVAAATVAHLFDDEAAVSRWMREVFLEEFQRNVGRPVGPDQRLDAVDKLVLDGFHDEAVGVRVLQSGPDGLVSSTVVDFRVGRLLGVAFVVTVGDRERSELARSLGLELERKTIRRVLSSG